MNKKEFLFHEKTLEMNITHELLNLANGIVERWNVPYPYRDPFWHYFWGLHLQVDKQAIAYGLHTNVEGKASLDGIDGGGHDFALLANSGDFMAFFQIKAGVLKKEDPGRISFDLSTKWKNGKKGTSQPKKPSQFRLFWDLYRKSDDADTTLIPDKNDTNPTYYIFPGFSGISEVFANAGKLLRRTRIVSPELIVADASASGKNLFRDEKHGYSLDLNTMRIPMIESKKTEATDDDSQYAFVGDILMIRLWRVLNTSPQLRNKSVKFVQFVLKISVFQILGIYPSAEFMKWAQNNSKDIEIYGYRIFRWFERFDQRSQNEENFWENGIIKHLDTRIDAYSTEIEGQSVGQSLPIPALLAFRHVKESGRVPFPNDFAIEEFSNLYCLVL